MRRLAVAWLIAVVYAFPGQMTDESFAILHSARGRFSVDDAAPALGMLWRLIELVIAGPAPILALQVGLFVAGAYAVLRRAFTPERAGWVVVGCVAMPPVLASIGVISPASFAAALCVAGAGALLQQRTWLGLAALFAATCVRESALVATLPLVVMLAPRDRATFGIAITTRLHGVIAWLAISLATLGTDAALGGHLYSGRLAAFDQVGTHAAADDHGPYPNAYSPANSLSAAAIFGLPMNGSTPANRDQLARDARALALEHPGAYLVHRVAVFGAVTWIGGAREVVPDALDDPPRMGVPTYRNHVQRAIAAVLAWLPLVMAPWLWLLLAAVTAIAGRKHVEVRALIASGLASEIALTFTATSTAYPQSLWLVASTCLAAAITWRRR